MGLRSARAADNDFVRIAYSVDVASWDPIATGQGQTVPIHKSVFDMPLSFSPDFSVGPSVVSKVRWLDDKAMALELTLREGVTFHNGDPLTSDDIKFSLQERPAADKSLMIAGLWGDGKVATVETPSPTVAVFKFKSPYVSAPALLGSIPAYILPRRYYERVGREKFMENPIGSGPYRLVDYERNSRISLEAYDKYWGGAPRIRRATFQIMRDASARVAAIQSGQADFTNNLPVREALRLGGLPGLTAAIHPINSAVMVRMVNKGLFQDINLRLAMHHAIDKEALSKAFYGGRAVPISMWASDGPTYDPTFNMEFSPDKAKAYLAKSGYSMEKPAKIKFGYVVAQFPNDFDIARTLVQMWRRVGIEADLEALEQAKYYEFAHADKLEMPVLFAWTNSSGDPELFSGLFMDPRKRNSVWKSGDINERLDPLLVEPDEAKRMAGYRAFDRWTIEQGYAIPMLLSTASTVHATRLNYVPYRTGWALPYAWSFS